MSMLRSQIMFRFLLLFPWFDLMCSLHFLNSFLQTKSQVISILDRRFPHKLLVLLLCQTRSHFPISLSQCSLVSSAIFQTQVFLIFFLFLRLQSALQNPNLSYLQKQSMHVGAQCIVIRYPYRYFVVYQRHLHRLAWYSSSLLVWLFSKKVQQQK